MATKKKCNAPSKTISSQRPRCGLCHKTTNLTRTPCCGHWICDDYDKYEMFSFSSSSCRRNHDRYTLCCYHFSEGHQQSDWRTCRACREKMQTEMYVWYGTNEFNFVKLKKPPAFEPTRCSACGHIVRLGTDAYTIQGDEHLCAKCFLRRLNVA